MRDETGKFVKGTSGNPNGRPKKDVHYFEILQSACLYDQWDAIVRRAVEQAQTGDRYAREWLANYIMGAPEAYAHIIADTNITLSFDEWQDDGTPDEE